MREAGSTSGREPSEKERLFELLVHDLTSPLSVITGSAARLLRRAAPHGALAERERSTLDRILRNARRSQLVLQDMIEILRSEEGLFQKRPFAVGEVLREAIMEVLDAEARETGDGLARERDWEKFRAMLERLGISIALSGKYAGAAFPHDPRRVQQIVRNLLSNALKHRRQRAAVAIGGDGDLIVSVEDDGPGISDEDQQALFQRFVRLKGSEEHPSVPGLGLGLAGVKALVEAMGGSIAFASREGLGTRFSVRIPPLE